MKTIGPVSYVDVYFDRNGKSKGCGVVEFETLEDAKRAIAELNDTELDGRKIFLREDQPENKTNKAAPAVSASSTGASTASTSSPAPVSGKKVYVGNLSFETTSDDLKKEFASVGTIVNAEVARHADSQRSKGWGIVEFSSDDEAQKAIAQFNKKVVGGRPLSVYLDKK